MEEKKRIARLGSGIGMVERHGTVVATG